jgi:hypothetical protein
MNILSDEVAVDADRVPTGLASTQRRRGSPRPGDETELKKQAFRDNIASTLSSIGSGMEEANAISRQANFELSIMSLRSAIAEEEDRIERLMGKMHDIDVVLEKAKYKMYERMLTRHEARLVGYEETMVEKRKELIAVQFGSQ